MRKDMGAKRGQQCRLSNSRALPVHLKDSKTKPTNWYTYFKISTMASTWLVSEGTVRKKYS